MVEFLCNSQQLIPCSDDISSFLAYLYSSLVGPVRISAEYASGGGMKKRASILLWACSNGIQPLVLKVETLSWFTETGV